MANELRNFLELSYDELEQLNLESKEQRKNRVPIDKIREVRLKYLADEKRIKAVTVLFSDLEGRLHMLDYDKKFLIKSWDNLTFDGAARERPASRYLLGRFLLGARGCLWHRQNSCFWRCGRQGRHALRSRHSRPFERLRGRLIQEKRTHPECRERD